MHKLVLVRHGQSEWNLANRFTGWKDVDLSEKGYTEAHEAGQILKHHNFTFDVAYTSVLKRAIRTLWIIMDEMDAMWLPVKRHWRLNERHYGALQGLNKKETAEKHGDEQVHIWRRSYDVRPPALTREDPRYIEMKDARYAGFSDNDFPLCESLHDTVNRFVPYWEDEIAPALREGKKLIISAHGNSLRALIKHVDNVSDSDIVGYEIPTGKPLIYELDDDLKPIKHYYLES